MQPVHISEEHVGWDILLWPSLENMIDHEDIHPAFPASPSPSPPEAYVKCDRLGDEWVEH